jgi:hypothetical protein
MTGDTCGMPFHTAPPIRRYGDHECPHWCHECGERFVQVLSRDVHIIVEHGRAPTPCEEET